MNKRIKTRLNYLRRQIEKECISYGEIAELQSLVKYIDKDDVLLLEWAGVEEHSEKLDYQLSVEQRNRLRDLEGFIKFCREENRDYFWTLANIAHDTTGLLNGEKFFVPRSCGYKEVLEAKEIQRKYIEK